MMNIAFVQFTLIWFNWIKYWNLSISNIENFKSRHISLLITLNQIHKRFSKLLNSYSFITIEWANKKDWGKNVFFKHLHLYVRNFSRKNGKETGDDHLTLILFTRMYLPYILWTRQQTKHNTSNDSKVFFWIGHGSKGALFHALVRSDDYSI